MKLFKRKSKAEETAENTEAAIEETSEAAFNPAHSNDLSKSAEFVERIAELMQLNCEVIATDEGDAYRITVVGPDASLLIGFHGETLDNLQYLATIVAGKGGKDRKRIVVDAENYRSKRSETLEKLSHRLAAKVAKSGHEEVLEPMNSFERRVIHTALADNASVVTRSEGAEPRRYVVISPKDMPLRDSYSMEDRNSFKRTGAAKTRSFGQKKRYW